MPKTVKKMVNRLLRDGLQKAMKFFKVDCNERFIMDILDHFPFPKVPISYAS
ncbi:MAG: hypothetical protein ACLPP9_16525 [Smithella sp.]